MILSELSVGSRIADVNSVYNEKTIFWTIASKNHYGENQVTLISDILCIKPFDAKEANNTNSRNVYGNNRYSVSNIHTWLNSSLKEWYVPKHSLDAPPTSSNVTANPYDTEVGFCANLTRNFLNKIKDTTIRVVKPSVDGGGSENISCKFFLPSFTEVGFGNENNIAEGSKFELFTDNNSRISKYNNAATVWALRTPASTSNAYDIRHVRTTGDKYTNQASYGITGIRIVCNISSNIEVEMVDDFYALKLDEYLDENVSMNTIIDELNNKKETLKTLKENIFISLKKQGKQVTEKDKLTTLVAKMPHTDISILENKISILEAENVQRDEEALVSMLALVELFEMMLSMTTQTVDLGLASINIKSIGGNGVIQVYVTLILKGAKTIEDVPVMIREEVQKQLDLVLK